MYESRSIGEQTSPQVPEFPLVGLICDNESMRAEIARVAGFAGIDVVVVENRNELSPFLLQLDATASPPHVAISFHPTYARFFDDEEPYISPFDEAERLMELFLAVGSTRRGWIVGVVGAHGGAGASVLATWIARRLSNTDEVALLDMDPLSSGLDRFVGLHGAAGLRWADLKEEGGAFVPQRLNDVLPRLGSLRILSGDRRGGVAAVGNLGEHAIAALAQVNAVTVIDLPRQALLPQGPIRNWLEWCDVVVLVATASHRGIAQAVLAAGMAQSVASTLPVVQGINPQPYAEELSAALRGKDVEYVHNVRTLRLDLEHGVRVGDRRRGASAADVARVTERCLPQVRK